MIILFLWGKKGPLFSGFGNYFSWPSLKDYDWCSKDIVFLKKLYFPFENPSIGDFTLRQRSIAQSTGLHKYDLKVYKLFLQFRTGKEL